jgi:hypothetical protein
MEKIMKKIDGLNTNKWKAIEFFKENWNWNKAGKGQWDSQDIWGWIKWHVKQLGRDRKRQEWCFRFLNVRSQTAVESFIQQFNCVVVGHDLQK